MTPVRMHTASNFNSYRNEKRAVFNKLQEIKENVIWRLSGLSQIPEERRSVGDRLRDPLLS